MGVRERRLRRGEERLVAKRVKGGQGGGPASGAAGSGYSGTPLVQKLGIRAGQRVLVLHDEAGEILRAVGDLPDGVAVAGRAGKRAVDVIVLAAPDGRTLRSGLGACLRVMKAEGSLWVCWYKKSSGVATDLDEDRVREVGLAAGLVDVKVCAVTGVWSGLKFVVPVEARAAWGVTA